MLRKAIVSCIDFEDPNSTIKRGIATIFRSEVKQETDPIPSIQTANDLEEITTLADSEEGKV